MERATWISIFVIILLIGIYIWLNHTIYQKRSLMESYRSKIAPEEEAQISNEVQYLNLLLGNLRKGTLTEMKIRPKDVRREDCDEKCGAKDCKQMYEQQKNLNSCRTCQKDPKKCFHKTQSGGLCDDCQEGETQLQCDSVMGDNLTISSQRSGRLQGVVNLSQDQKNGFGCPNPNDLYARTGVDPYYVIKTTFGQNNNIEQTCIFCNDLTDLI